MSSATPAPASGSSAPNVTAKAGKTTAKLTAYRVLKEVGGPEPSWIEIHSGDARNAADAIRKAVEKNGPGTYAAPPESSWKPVSVTVESVTVIKLGEPAA